MISAMFNHFGFIGVPDQVDHMHRLGFLAYDMGETLRQLLRHGMKAPPVCHRQVVQLIPYSHFAKFVVSTRKVFLREFAKYAEDFTGVDAEAMFLGTVMHSVDHFQCVHLFSSWDARSDKPEFAPGVEWARYVWSYAADELPMPLWIRCMTRFEHASHPLFKACFRHARKISPVLASEMELCVIR